MIRCEEVMEEISVVLLAGEPRDEEVSRHLESCASCREEARELESMWRRFEELPEGRPGPELRRRFEEMLAREIVRQPAHRGRRGVRNEPIPRRDRVVAFRSRPGYRLALGGALTALVVGFLGGAWIGSRIPDPGVEGLRGQVAELHEMVALSLLELDSASRRLQAVRYSTEIGASQPPLREALLQAVSRDRNVNVRLAALDALAPVAGETEVVTRLLRSLPNQESALVQIEMIDLLLEVDGQRARPGIRRLAEVEELPREVRRHIEARLGSRI